MGVSWVCMSTSDTSFWDAACTSSILPELFKAKDLATLCISLEECILD